ncbi:MAG: PaaI family thioesterase, partial [Acidimicrobiia bacterium]|nr:PaaI family thioesterase [Acidimicrobiia bacterium]
GNGQAIAGAAMGRARTLSETLATIETILGVDLRELSKGIAGNLANGPRFDLTGMFARSIEEGAFTGVVSASPWLSAGTPFMYGGVIAWICDGTLSAAMWSTLAPGEALAVLDIEVRFLRPVPLDGSTLDVSSRVVHGGRTIRVAEVQITNPEGKAVAIATGSGMVLPGGLTAFFRGRPPEEIVGV